MADETFVFVKLNHRLMPVERGEMFEDPLQERIAEFGEVVGGGTMQTQDGEIAFVGIDVQLRGELDDGVRRLVEALERLGAPKGSELEVHVGEEVRTVPFGVLEGVAVYLDGTGLPDEVYETCDVNVVVEEIDERCEGVGMFVAHWQGPTETALYVYGRSADTISDRIAPLIASYPLCAGARVVRIA